MNLAREFGSMWPISRREAHFRVQGMVSVPIGLAQIHAKKEFARVGTGFWCK